MIGPLTCPGELRLNRSSDERQGFALTFWTIAFPGWGSFTPGVSVKPDLTGRNTDFPASTAKGGPRGTLGTRITKDWRLPRSKAAGPGANSFLRGASGED